MNPPAVPEPPALAAPGAGLPSLELVIVRLWFAFQRRRATLPSIAAQIRDERAKIDALVASCPPDRRAKRVLIPRPRGLEDSSRYWSVLMTLEHLRIVNGGVTMAVTELLAGRVPGRAASTAAVKPSADVTDAVIAEYQTSCDRMLAAGAEAASLHTRVRYAHPWFGPLDAFGWKLLGATHLALHRRQIEAILALAG